MWIQPVFSVTELATIKLKSDADMLLDIFQTFSGQLFIGQLWMTTIIF